MANVDDELRGAKVVCFLAVCDKNDEKGTDYKLDMISPTSNNIILTDTNAHN